jgi:NTE family protein
MRRAPFTRYDPETMNEPFALILTGAVAKGPFHAGVISVLAHRGVPIGSVVGTSAGALNATVYAAGLATGRVRHAARVAQEIWLDHASWSDIVSPSLTGLLHGQGLFDAKRIRHMLSDALAQILDSKTAPDRAPISDIHLRMVATDLLGHLKSDEGPDEPTQTTFERCFAFGGADFASSTGRARILDCATASGTFPGVFAPSSIDGRPYADGGAVNNAPISYAIEPLSTNRLIVVSGEPAEMSPPESLGGLGLMAQIVDILINERLFRDLRGARKTNEKLAGVEAALRDPAVPEAVRDKVRDALGWRPLDIVEIRPLKSLEGNAFAGFRSRELRQAYFDEGRRRAEAIVLT